MLSKLPSLPVLRYPQYRNLYKTKNIAKTRTSARTVDNERDGNNIYLTDKQYKTGKTRRENNDQGSEINRPAGEVIREMKTEKGL